MLTSSIVSVDSSRVYKPKASQVGLLSTAISKIGDSSFVSKTRESSNISPVKMRLFRDSSPKQSNKGLNSVVVGEYHPLTPAHIVFSSIHKSTSPVRSSRAYNESPQRAKVRLDRFKNWDSKLGIELQLQNTKFTRLNNELTYQSHQPYHHPTKSAVFLGSNLSRLSFGGNQSDLNILTAKLNAITPSQVGSFTVSHAHELSNLQQSLSRIMKSSRQY